MRLLVASIVATQLVAATVRADATEDAALLHLERGVAAFEAGKFTLAHEELSIASRLAPHKPNPYRWLALALVQLGDCRRALVNIAAFVEHAEAGDPRLAELVRLRELCERTGVLSVSSTPTHAALRIDGAVVGTTPYRSLSMRAGSHRLVVEKPGFAAASRSIVLTAGGELDVQLRLARADMPITKRWWFWPSVLGTALVIAGVAVYVATDASPTLLPPIQCDPGGCRPGAS
jgi:hypothetical protein